MVAQQKKKLVVSKDAPLFFSIGKVVGWRKNRGKKERRKEWRYKKEILFGATSEGRKGTRLAKNGRRGDFIKTSDKFAYVLKKPAVLMRKQSF